MSRIYLIESSSRSRRWRCIGRPVNNKKKAIDSAMRRNEKSVRAWYRVVRVDTDSFKVDVVWAPLPGLRWKWRPRRAR